MHRLFRLWGVGVLGLALLLANWVGLGGSDRVSPATPLPIKAVPAAYAAPLSPPLHTVTVQATTPMTTTTADIPQTPGQIRGTVAVAMVTSVVERLAGGGAAELTYVFPVRAESYEYGRYHHDYPATDIFCPVGSEYLATTSGVVDFVNAVDQWDAATNAPALRGGIMIAIIGDDGWRYYGSHLSSVAEGLVPGVRVRAGQLLGYTGKSGNAQGTPPHLHYGISYPTTPDDWQTRRGQIPPYDYLQAWERGEQVTPRP